MARTKVRYTRTTIKQIVKILDPKPEKEITYRFTGGRVFKKLKDYS